MNKRIFELAKQAAAVEGWGPEVWQTTFTEKFAELLVQDYAKRTIQGLMTDPAFVQAMDEYYENKWSHRFD